MKFGSNFSRQEKYMIAILAFVNFTHIMDFVIMMPLGPKLIRLFEISSAQFGLLLSSYTLAAGIMGLASAFFLDRFDRKSALLFMFTGFSVATLLCALSPNYISLLLARTATGAFGGVLNSICLAIVSDKIPLERRATAMGMLMLGFSLASVFGLPFGLYLSDLFDWHAPFLLLGGISCLALFVVVKYIPSIKDHLMAPRKSHGAMIMNVLRDNNKISALLFMACLILGQFTVISFLSPSLVGNVGLKESQLPLIYLVGGICSIISSPLAGHLSDQHGKKKIFTYGALLSFVPLLVMTHTGPMPLALTLFFAALFFVAMSGRIIPAQTLVSATVRPEDRGGFMSFVSSIQNFSSAIASLLTGFIITIEASGAVKNFEVVGYIACAFTTLALFLGRRLKSVEGA